MMKVIMHFDRFRLQTAIESNLGCTDLTKWSNYRQNFLNFEVNASNHDFLLTCLHKDGLDNFYKGLYSISNGLFNIYNGYYSWSIIKFYYAVFYLIRTSFSANNVGFLKNNGIFTLKIDQGEKPVRRDLDKYKGEKMSGDHKSTIFAHIKDLGDQDILLTNNIGELNVYEWLMEVRNQINYRERCFLEPDIKYIPTNFLKPEIMKEHIDNYFKDEELVYCFNEDHACVAAPIKILQKVSSLYYQASTDRLSTAQIGVLENMLKPMGLHEITGIKEILYPT